MVTGSLARRYARALMEIGRENNSYELIGKELRRLADAMEASPELRETLSNPAFSRDDRRKILEGILRRLAVSGVAKNTSLLLLDNERIAHVPDICRELEAMIAERAGRTTAEVVSATPLTPMQVTQLQKALEQLSGKKVEIVKSEDPELLGGVVARVGDVVYDGSLRTKLQSMREGMGD